MATYLDNNIVCIKDGGDGFAVGNVYELLEVDGVYVAENDDGQRLEAFRGKTNVAAGNSGFEYWIGN
ncbi:hypothetical protein M0K91_RS23460 [Serratia marcescens]|uniref:hypothetical protein n=1 Tax=Serratia marcescens TaxID=615 RepID=UPI003F7D25AF|nr:hypothetical protein [Serratia marcescens]